MSTAGPLDILFCTLDYHPGAAGGAERQARLQAEALVKRGHRVTVCCPRNGDLPRRQVVDGVNVRRLYVFPHRPLSRVTYLITLTLFLLRHMRSFDLVHVHLANLQADVVVGLATVLRRPTYVKVACGGSAGEVKRLAKVAWLTRWTGLRRARRVQALSDEIAGELVSIGVAPERILRVPNGVHLPEPGVGEEADQKRELRHRLGLPEDRTIVLFVGRFAAYKGLHDLLAVWESREWPDAVLLLVGAPAVDKPMDPIVANERVIVHGWAEDVRPYLEAADVFVYPSYADGMSNALLEALAAGMPTVASRSGAAEEMIVDGESGILFDAGDRAQLARALDTILGDAELRDSFGRRVQDDIRKFSIDRVVDEIEREYRQMLGSGPA